MCDCSRFHTPDVSVSAEGFVCVRTKIIMRKIFFTPQTLSFMVVVWLMNPPGCVLSRSIHVTALFLNYTWFETAIASDVTAEWASHATTSLCCKQPYNHRLITGVALVSGYDSS